MVFANPICLFCVFCVFCLFCVFPKASWPGAVNPWDPELQALQGLQIKNSRDFKDSKVAKNFSDSRDFRDFKDSRDSRYFRDSTDSKNSTCGGDPHPRARSLPEKTKKIKNTKNTRKTKWKCKNHCFLQQKQ